MSKSKLLAGVIAMIITSSAVIFIPNNEKNVTAFSSVTVVQNEATSNHKDGWYNVNNEKCYYYNGEKIVSKTKVIDGKMYLFDEKGYLLKNGFHTINGKKYYSNKDGTIKCNQWVAHKEAKTGNTYYYATSSGRITEYKFQKQKNKKIYLLVNGKKATADTLPLYGTYDLRDILGQDTNLLNSNNSIIELRCGYFKVASDYYHLNYSISDDCVICDEANKLCEETYNCADNALYDLGSGKHLGSVLGKIWSDEKGIITSGGFLNPVDHYFYYFENGKTNKMKAESPIVITKFSEKMNSVGGVDLNMCIANNSGKTINYLYYSVHVVNGVGDTVYCTVADKKSFSLKSTGPYAPGETSGGTWEAFMYNYSAKKVVIDKLEIIYKDGTSVTLNGSAILSLDI